MDTNTETRLQIKSINQRYRGAYTEDGMRLRDCVVIACKMFYFIYVHRYNINHFSNF